MEKLAVYPSLRGRAVLITGGASGIGASLVTQFCRQGALVSFLDVPLNSTRLRRRAAREQRVGEVRARRVLEEERCVPGRADRVGVDDLFRGEREGVEDVAS